MKTKTQKLRSRKIMMVVTVISIAVIPLLYSFFYLDAFWDPYSKLELLPVAVVNEDVGAIIDNTSQNFGESISIEMRKSETFNYSITDATTAKNGLYNDEYYAVITFPKNFSANIASASEIQKVKAIITYSPNEKHNYLASQILGSAMTKLEASVRGQINRQITDRLASKISSVPEQLKQLSAVIGEMKEGSHSLAEGSNKLYSGTDVLKSGTNTLNDKISSFQAGINNLQSGSTDLNQGVYKLNDGLANLLKGADRLQNQTETLEVLHINTQLLSESSKQLYMSFETYISGVNSLIIQTRQVQAVLNILVDIHPELLQDPAFSQFISSFSGADTTQKLEILEIASIDLEKACKRISDGTKTLADSTSDMNQLKEGIKILKEGLAAAKDNCTLIKNGSDNLTMGMKTISDATVQINAATENLREGAIDINMGAFQVAGGAANLQNGISQTQVTVSGEAENAKNQMMVLEGLGDYSQKPALVTSQAVNSVPNYGTAFAPYFMCLSLWVGGISMFFGLYYNKKFKFWSSSNTKITRSLAYLLLGVSQAVALALIGLFVLGLKVQHTIIYFLGCCIISITFITIEEFFFRFLKDSGKLLVIILLILQLTACGGTYPIELLPSFFKTIYPFMPMTYGLNLLKEVISSESSTHILSNMLILMIIATAFICLNLLLPYLRGRFNRHTALIPESD